VAAYQIHHSGAVSGAERVGDLSDAVAGAEFLSVQFLDPDGRKARIAAGILLQSIFRSAAVATNPDGTGRFQP
jgi:hypothetical protein